MNITKLIQLKNLSFKSKQLALKCHHYFCFRKRKLLLKRLKRKFGNRKKILLITALNIYQKLCDEKVT